MKITHTLLLAALTTLVVPCAFANSIPYVGAEVGEIQLTDSFSDIFSSITGMDERIFAGTLWGDGAFKYGVEGDGMYFGDASMADPYGLGYKVDFRGYAVGVLGVVKYDFDSGFSLSAKAGPTYLHEQVTNVSSMDTGHGQVCPEVALGVGYHFTHQLEGQLTADTILASQSGPNPLFQTKSLNVGLTYHFA